MSICPFRSRPSRSAPAALLGLVAVFATQSAVAAPPVGYYDRANGLSGPALKAALRTIVSNQTALPYSSSAFDTADAMKLLDEDASNTVNVLPYYKLAAMSKSSFGLAGQAGWNREHVWPQSLGADVSPQKTDLNSLFAEEASLNSSRNNSVYDIVATADNTRDGNRWTGDRFEPRAASRGNLSRAVFYFATRYPGTVVTNSVTPAYNEMGRLSVLLPWNRADAVDAREGLRNDRVYQLQGNRNPYIDNPLWIDSIFAPVATSNTVSAIGTDRAGSTVAPGSARAPMLNVTLTAATGEWDAKTLTVSKTGTLDRAKVTVVGLFADANGDGIAQTSDPRLASGTFDAGNNLVLTLTDAIRATTTTPARLLVAYDLAADAGIGLTIGATVTSVTCDTATGGADTNPGLLSLASSTPLVSVGGVTSGDSLSVDFQSVSGTTVAAGTVRAPLAAVAVRASANEWDLASIAVAKLGTLADAAVTNLELFLDADANGAVSAGDTLLDARAFSAGATTFTLASPLRVLPTTASLLLTATVSATATQGATLGLRVVAGGIVHNSTGGADLDPVTGNLDAAAVTVSGGVSDGDSVAVFASSKAPTSVPAGAQNAPMLAVDLNTTTSGEWDLGRMRVELTGSIPTTNVLAINLYNDVAGDGVVQGTDTLLDSAAVPTSRSVEFRVDGGVRVLATTVSLLVAIELSPSATPGTTVGARLRASGLDPFATGGADTAPANTAADSALSTVTGGGGVKIAMVSTRHPTLGAFAEYVVLVNLTDFPVDLTGWSLKKLAGTGAGSADPYNVNLAGTIPAQSHFLVASAAFTTATAIDGAVADLFVDNQQANPGLFGNGMTGQSATALGLFDGAEKVDGFAWGANATGDAGAVVPIMREGMPYTPTFGSSSAEGAGVYRRKAVGPVYQDGDSNSADLTTQARPSPPPGSSVFAPVRLSEFTLY